MHYRKYGRMGYEVSVFGMGCMRLPRREKSDGTPEIDREKAIEIMQYAANHGVNYFDTAFGYHGGESETVLGEALDGGLREKVHVVTKQPFSAMKQKSDIRRNLENTLKKLRTDYIDMYLVHNVQPQHWDDICKMGVYEEYEKFREEGLIKGIGISYHGPFDTFKKIIDTYDWDMCQIQQNLLDVDKQATEQGILYAGEKGKALVIMEPLRGGGLANAPGKVKELYDTFPVKRTPAQWAFRHLYNYPQISCILSGVTTLEQLKQNIETFSAPDVLPNCMTEEEKQIIKKAKELYEERIAIPCTKCEYCMPCPHVNIPEVFRLYNTGKMFENFDNPRRMYSFRAMREKDASHCIKCGACETKCPQHIDIRNQLAIAHEALKGWKE